MGKTQIVSSLKLLRLLLILFVEPPGRDKTAHKTPRITFSDNSSSLIRCIPNERATFFVKIDCDEDEESELLPFKFEW